MPSARAIPIGSALWPALVLAAGVAGCATAPAGPAGARSAEMERTMVELRAQNAGYLRQIEELQNRIFILEDKLDSRRIADDQRGTPTLPLSKRIGGDPPSHTAATRAATRLSEGAVAPEDDDESTVEYAGEAARPLRRGRARPQLRLSGTGRAVVMMAAPSLPPETSVPAEPIPAEPLRLYREALAALRAGHDAVALAGFRKFLARYPRHDYADNAQYWIGECYYDLKEFRSAVREFRRVVERYPHGNKVPDAMLKLGFAHLADGDRRDGRQVLVSLRRSYPRHAAARLATERLAQADDRAPPTVTLEMGRK
jgi:tol-pal system protein YbgF